MWLLLRLDTETISEGHRISNYTVYATQLYATLLLPNGIKLFNNTMLELLDHENVEKEIEWIRKNARMLSRNQ